MKNEQEKKMIRHFTEKNNWITSKHIKKFSESLIIREIQMKIMIKHLTQVRMAHFKNSRNTDKRMEIGTLYGRNPTIIIFVTLYHMVV